jgi:bacteriorhodopsin
MLKMPLIILPLRALLLEQLGIPPIRSGLHHLLLTTFMVCCTGVAAMFMRNLAYAFQVAGCTAGVMVCFCLPGLLYFGAHRMEATQTGAALYFQSSPATSSILPSSREEAAGLCLFAAGAVSGIMCLIVLLGE